MNNIVAKIIKEDRLLGNLAQEAEECYSEDKNMAALACLFILVEQAIKFGLEKTEGNFADLIKEAKENGILSQIEFDMLNDLRKIRNGLFHETHYSWILEEDGVASFFSENETKEKIYALFSTRCFEIVLKMLSL